MDNIQNRDTQYGIAMGWHGKTKLAELLTAALCFPYEIVMAPLWRGEQKIPHDAWFVPICSDDGLPVGNGRPMNDDSYTLRCPKDLWKLRDEVLQGTENQVVSAGSVDNRARFFISSKLVGLEKLSLKDGSTMELLLNSIGSLDGSLKEQHSLSGIRIVCQNTLMLSYLTDKTTDAKGRKSRFRYRHSKNMNEKIESEKSLMEIVAGQAAIAEREFNALIEKPCTLEYARIVYTGALCPTDADEISKRADNMIDVHLTSFQRGPGNSGKSMFDLLNGYTEPRSTGYPDSDKDKWDTFATSEFGAYARQKEAFAKAVTYGGKPLADIEANGRRLLGELLNKRVFVPTPDTNTDFAALLNK